MVATLQSRKEALEAKILEKNEELKKLCLQEADLTGVIPPEIPLEPGEPPPPIRRRVGTSFSFPQNLINNVKDADDDALTALELECKVQTNIAEAALALANDASANKAARRKHRLMYRQSQRRLTELESQLTLLKQGKAQPLKLHQIKKKPRPNTTAVENLSFLWNKTNDNNQNHSGSHLGIWPNKIKTDYSSDDIDGSREFLQQSDAFGSLHRSFKSSGTSQSSGSPRTDIEGDEFKAGINLSNSISNHFVPGYLPHSSMPDVEACKLNLSPKLQHKKRNGKHGVVRKQWDTQSAGGTLLPSQTYPDHSHQPNLSRTQSLGSVESNPQKSKDSWSMQDFSYEGTAPKEKEWYETSLDSAPSPPLRTTSRLPPSARLLYQMQENHLRDFGNWGGNASNLQPSTSHPALPTTPNLLHRNVTRSASAYPASDNISVGVENLADTIPKLHINPSMKGRNSNIFQEEPGIFNQNDLLNDYANAEVRQSFDFSANIPKLNSEGARFVADLKPKLGPLHPGTSSDVGFIQNPGLQLIRQNSLTQLKHKNNNSGNESVIKKQDDNFKQNNSIYINIPEDNSDLQVNNWLNDEEFVQQRKGGQVAVPQEYVAKTQTPTQPYYHTLKTSPGEKINLQYQAARNRHASITEEPGNYQLPSPVHTVMHHPPHAITQNEISFDTVVPFESPQNHTVVQAGKWQPYREVTKPFEMSDFYKYSTKFRQNKAAQGNRTSTPDVSRNSPNTTMHQKGIYTPLKPMTCRPVDSRSNQFITSNQEDVQCDDGEKTLVEVSPPEITQSIRKWKMRLFPWSVLRRFGDYVKVKKPDNYKVVVKPTDEEMSVSKHVHLKIQSGGPITVADYMRTVLTMPDLGYYMQKDIIGRKGDFITSPEISQLFGEMIAVWICHEFQKMGSPKPWQIIELGPGRGTLMRDILRVLKTLKSTDDLSVHMVEVSPMHAKIQLQHLSDDPVTFGVLPQKSKENPYYKSSKTEQGVPIFWYEKLEQVPSAFSVILAHEFFDALPIHKFQKVPEGWREILINSKQTDDKQIQFEYVLSKNETAMSKLLIRKDETREHVEVCPEGGALARYISERLEEFGGFGLFIDYGHNGEKTDTFRAFKKHQLHDPLVNPGSADLTADVDFSFLKEILKEKMLVYGPVEQGDFLRRLGIKVRLDMVLNTAKKEHVDAIKSAYRMIVDKDQMGARYKCLAVFPSVLEEFRRPYIVEGFYEKQQEQQSQQ